MSDANDASRNAALSALDRAHAAALAANGAELRRALEDAEAALREANSPFADQVGRALVDLDSGSLAELEVLVEDARRALSAGAG